MNKLYIIVWIYHILLIYLLIDSSHFWLIMNIIALHMHVHIFVWIYAIISLEYKPRNRIAES